MAKRAALLCGGAFVVACALACSPSGPRDVAGESTDVRVDPREAGAPGAETYVYIARRPHGVIALAEARHMTEEDSREIVDRLASDLEVCASRLEAEGTLVEGAARVVAVAQPSGPPGLNVRIAPGGEVAQNALMCLIAPVRAIAFPPARAGGPPGMAIEATWGPLARVPATQPAAGVDAGGSL